MIRRNKIGHLVGWFSLLREESGAGIVEYSIVFILLITMLLAIADFSRAVYAYHFASNMARDAARYASVRGSTCGPPPIGDSSCTTTNDASGVAGPFTNAQATTDIQDFAKNAPTGINSASITVTPSWPNPSSLATCTTTFNAPGCTVKVQVSYAFSFFSPLVSKHTLTLSSTSQEIITH